MRRIPLKYRDVLTFIRARADTKSCPASCFLHKLSPRLTKMMAKTVDDKSHSLPHDPEKTGVHAAPRSGSIDNPEGLSYTIDTNRETDFRTRNGLNLRSFQRRESITHLPTVPD